MGAKNSKGRGKKVTNNYGDFVISTNKSGYYPGETVDGIVVLNLTRDFPGTQLFLRCKGKERVFFIEKASKNCQQEPSKSIEESRSAQQFHRSKNNKIFDFQTIIHTFGEGIAKQGQYTVPFSFIVPTVPGSFFQKGPGFIAEIAYQIEAFIEPTKMSIETPRLKFKTDLFIEENARPQTASVSNEMTYKVGSWLFRSPSHFYIHYSIDKSVYQPGDSINIKVDVDNSKGKLPIKYIVVKLKQKLVVQTELAQVSYDVLYAQTTTPLVKARKTAVGANSCIIRLKLPEAIPNEHFKYNRRCEPDFIRSVKEASHSMMFAPSRNGRLISSKYLLEIKPCVEGWGVDSRKFDASCVEFELAYSYPSLPELIPPVNWMPENLQSVDLPLRESVNLTYHRNQQSQENRRNLIESEANNIRFAPLLAN